MTTPRDMRPLTRKQALVLREMSRYGSITPLALREWLGSRAVSVPVLKQLAKRDFAFYVGMDNWEITAAGRVALAREKASL